MGPSGDTGDGRRADFATQLRLAREAAGLTQDELAERAGISPNAVGGLERGEHRRPYPATVRALAAALGLSDAERAALAAAVPQRGQPAATDAPIASALPALLSPLIGRDGETATVLSLITVDGARLVTLTGPGGVGKTALALRVAADLAGEFSGGVAWVPCATIREPGLLGPTIALALGVTINGGMPVADLIADVLRDRHLLLILDNLEHLLEAVPLVTEVLARCPRLVVLATSRTPLRLAGEHQVPVPPLPVPDPDRLTPVDTMGEVPAVRLFVARARAVDPTFALSDENAGAVAGICHRLDGLPLAIELAAAQAGILPPAAMLPRLAQRLPLLTGGRRDSPERHRTMRNAIAWSHDLLSEEERTLFRRLAVFVGGFSLQAGESVAGASDVDMVASIAALTDHHLLGRADGPAGEPRFAMLETIREFALDRLALSGEEDTVRRRHAAFVLELAEGAEPALLGPDQVAWLDLLEDELANVRAALAWLNNEGDADDGLRLAAALWTFWVVRDRVPEGRRWLETFLAKGAPGTLERTKALVALGDLCERQGDYDVAAAWLDEAVALARTRGDPAGEAAGLRVRANVAISMGEVFRSEHGDPVRAEAEYARAEERLRRSLDLAAAAGDAWGVAKTKHWLGIVSLEREDLVRADAELREALEDFRRLGDLRQICMVVGNIGSVAMMAGNNTRALAALAESLSMAQSLGYGWWVEMCLDLFGFIAAITGERERALRLFGATGTLRPQTGEPVRSGLVHEQARILAEIRAELGEEATATILRAGAAMSLQDAVEEALAVGSAAPPENAPAPSRNLPPPDSAGLTAREVDVLRLIVEGKTDPEIAETLFISRATVSKHVGAVLTKLGVPTRSAAAVAAVRRGLV